MANILVIDDDTQVGHLLRSHLKDEGHHVTVVQRGEDGMAAATIEAPDLIFLDVMLPDATGYQICSRLRKMEGIQNTPIIMMSGVARYPNQKQFGLDRGANEFLVKPFRILEVGDLVNGYLRKDPSPQAPKSHPNEKPKQAPAEHNPVLDEAGMKELRAFLKNVMKQPGTTGF